jgi:hypothetical protein
MSVPIFILGNPRSGSSVLCSCLRDVFGIQGYLEGHFLKYIEHYQHTTDQIFNNLSKYELLKSVAMGNVQKTVFENKIFEAFKITYESLLDLNQKYWLDKTPENYNKTHTINNLWPNAKFIFLKRRSLENIHSRIKKFPHLSFQKHCEEWVATMAYWYNLDKTFISDRLLEIEHYDLLYNIEKIANDLTDFLPEFKDKTKEIIPFFTNQYHQSTTGKKPTILDIDTIDWSVAQKHIHNTICEPTMKLYNYSLKETYFL